MPYRVTHTGDSISAMSFGYPAPGAARTEGDTYRNLNHGRKAYGNGMTMPHSNGSTWSIASLNAGRTEPWGWMVVQDNSIDATSDWEWNKLVTAIEAATPADVGLLGVLPGYVPAVDGEYAAVASRRADVMGQVFSQHPRYRFVDLNTYMVENPEQFPDGQHPDATAQAWIRAAILNATR